MNAVWRKWTWVAEEVLLALCIPGVKLHVQKLWKQHQGCKRGGGDCPPVCPFPSRESGITGSIAGRPREC